MIRVKILKITIIITLLQILLPLIIITMVINHYKINYNNNRMYN